MHQVDYYQHKYYKKGFNMLSEYLQDHESTQELLSYGDWLQERYTVNPTPLEEFLSGKKPVLNKGDVYPSDEFLISLHEETEYLTEEECNVLLNLIIDAWHCITPDDCVVRKDEVVLDTFGWSGNEDIIDALTTSNIQFLFKIRQDSNYPTEYHIRYAFKKEEEE